MKQDVHLVHAEAEDKFYKRTTGVLPETEFEEEVRSGNAYVVERDGAVVGYAFCRTMHIHDNPLIHDQRILFIDDFCIDNAHRRKGIATAFMTFLEDRAKEQGYTSVELNVWDFNEAALRFYENYGMRRTRIRMLKSLQE